MFAKLEVPTVNKHRSVANTGSDKAPDTKENIIFNDNRSEVAVQRKLQDKANKRTKMNKLRNTPIFQKKITFSNRLIQRKKTYYAYGSANEVPHIHVYRKGDCHLKIQHRNSIKRYNIVQNGRRHSQADIALEVAAGNDALVTAINDLL